MNDKVNKIQLGFKIRRRFPCFLPPFISEFKVSFRFFVRYVRHFPVFQPLKIDVLSLFRQLHAVVTIKARGRSRIRKQLSFWNEAFYRVEKYFYVLQLLNITSIYYQVFRIFHRMRKGCYFHLKTSIICTPFQFQFSCWLHLTHAYTPTYIGMPLKRIQLGPQKCVRFMEESALQRVYQKTFFLQK